MRFGMKTVVAILATGTSSQIGMAADNELYASPPPDDAAFIRWLDGPGTKPAFGIIPVEVVAGAYHPVSASAAQDLVAGTFYTVVSASDGLQTIIEEPDRDDKSKVHIVLLNTSSTNASVVVAGTSNQVIASTGPFVSASRAVNPVNAPLSVLAANGAELGSFDLHLRRGQNITLVVTDSGATLIENNFGANLEAN